ncbi:MAG: GDSL-type esterase/lipase family protein [Hyphomicrobiaceae bacterium]
MRYALSHNGAIAPTLMRAFILVAALCAMGANAAIAQMEGARGYITPFPGSERYKLRVIGDQYGEGMFGALQDALGSDPRLEFERRAVWLSGLTRPDSGSELNNIVRDAQSTKPNIVVIMFGSLDRWSYREGGNRYPVGSERWRSVYAERIDKLIRDLKATGAAIYWVGLPVMRSPKANVSAQTQNEVFREHTYLGGVRYIDVYQGFVDEQGEYSAYGPDIGGQNRLLRDNDGMHMTAAGYQKLAHFVEQAIKRDLRRAKSVRSIPLAGNEAEQALITPAKAVSSPDGGENASNSMSAGVGGTTQAATSAAGGSSGENSRINLRIAGQDGRERVVPIELLRPAIPAAVIAVVTRRSQPGQAAQMGDQVIDQIPGGLTVMSSITPAAGNDAGARSKLAPTQTPYFRVLVKGERIAARPGRADDTSWPPPTAPAPQKPPRNMSQTSDAGDNGGIPLPVAKPYR